MVALRRYIAPFDLRQIPWQAQAIRDKALINLFTGSAGGGKSRLGMEKLHAMMLHYPGATGLMLRKTRESVTNSLVLPFEYLVVGRDKRVNHVVSKSRFEYSNGSILVYGGMKNREQREQIRSVGLESGVDFILMEEATAFSEDDFNELLARLRGQAGSFRQIILATNPDQPAHWIYQRLIQNGEASVYYSGARDNPHNPAEYLAILEHLTGLLYKRLVLGQWVIAEGAVYDTFEPDVHILEELPRDPDLHYRRFVGGQDWGYTNPGVFKVYGIDSDGRLTLVKEIYRTRKLIGWWAEQAKALCDLYSVDTVICDPAEPGFIEEYTQAGIPAIPADNAIVAGIQKVQQRLAVQEDGQPRLYFYRHACDDTDPALEAAKQPTCTIEEYPAYVWAQGVDGKPNKEKPVDQYNHGLDVDRYVCAHLAESEGRVLSFR
jgi:phage terminase large subunit